MDETIVFHPLRRTEFQRIVEIQLERVRALLRERRLDLEVGDDARELLAERGYDPTLGARPLRRAIQRLLEDELSEKVLFGEFSANTTIVVDIDPDDEGALSFSEIETPDHPDVELAESEG